MAEPFDDDPLVRSLREPGTPGELADQDHYRAMYRESRGGGKVAPLTPGAPRRPGGRAARRLGAGTSLTIAIAVAGGGVAAAYTGSLPEPIQQFAHEMLGPVRVPAATEHSPDRIEVAPRVDPSPSGEETADSTPSDPGPTPTAEPSRPGDDPTPGEQTKPTEEPSASPSGAPTPLPSDTATATPSPTPTPTPNPAPTPTPTPTLTTDVVKPASVSITGSSHRVAYAAAPLFSGIVRSDGGTVVPETQVALMAREDGVWRRVAFATTDEEGAVAISSPPVYSTTSMRLQARGARSDRWRVTMHPELSLTTASVTGDTVTIVASARGGQQGDVVRLTGRRNGQRATLATGLLGPEGTVTFQVQQETRKARYGALLAKTDEHTADRSMVVVIKPKTPKNDDGDDDPNGSP